MEKCMWDDLTMSSFIQVHEFRYPLGQLPTIHFESLLLYIYLLADEDASRTPDFKQVNGRENNVDNLNSTNVLFPSLQPTQV